MSYFTEFEQAFLNFVQRQFTDKENAFNRMSDTEKAAILNASSFAELCAIPNNTTPTPSTFYVVSELAKQFSQNQTQSNEAFIGLLLKLEKAYHDKNQSFFYYGIAYDQEVEFHIHGFIQRFLEEISQRSDIPESLKRSIDARLFLRANASLYPFQQVVNESIKNKTFGWDLYEKLINLLSQYESILRIMPGGRTKQYNEQYEASIIHYMTDAEKVMQELLLLEQENRLDSNLVFALGVQHFYFYLMSKESDKYVFFVRKAAGMGNEFAQQELAEILLWGIGFRCKDAPATNVAEATAILQKLTQSQNKWVAAKAIDYMQQHYAVFAPSVTAPRSTAPFCLDSLRMVTTTTTEPTATPAASSSNSRKLPTNQVPTNLSLRR